MPKASRVLAISPENVEVGLPAIQQNRARDIFLSFKNHAQKNFRQSQLHTGTHLTYENITHYREGDVPSNPACLLWDYPQLRSYSYVNPKTTRDFPREPSYWLLGIRIFDVI